MQWWSNTTSIPDKWWHMPRVQQIWNEKITGSTQCSYIEYVNGKYFAENKAVTLLSPGCGTGHKELAIAKLFPDWKITGLDLSPQRIDTANKDASDQGLKNITFKAGDIYRESFQNERFDIVLFDSSLHHFRGFDTLFTQISTLLKPAGVIVSMNMLVPTGFNGQSTIIHRK